MIRHHHDTPLHPFMPSPTFNHSSPKSLATLLEVRDNKGDGSAARDAVRAKAATIILGEHKSGVSVTVNNRVSNNYTPGGVIQPGYICDLREPHELDADDPDYRPLIDVTPV